jgi:enterochelin esterase-like enzyme
MPSSHESTILGIPFQPGPYARSANSAYHDGVPRGIVTKKPTWRSRIFDGTEREWSIYVPAQYKSSQSACVMVFQDGSSYANMEGEMRAPAVFDNLIHKGEMPVTIAIFINPGIIPGIKTEGHDNSQRSIEYDTLSSRYASFLMEEILPEVARDYNLTQDPNCRAICGCSSGGICAFTVAWERPDAFRKVLSHVGSFADIRGGHVYPTLIRKSPTKPLRIFLQGGTNDLDVNWGHWTLANFEMAAAFKFKGYDHRFVVGDGAHDWIHGGAILPESLRWLFRK